MSGEKEAKKVLGQIAALPMWCGMGVLTPNARNVVNDTPLHEAALRNDSSAIEVLLKNGSEINAKGEHGYTALHEAVSQGHLNAVRTLVTAGALVNVENDFGETAVTLALKKGYTEIAKCIEDYRMEIPAGDDAFKGRSRDE